MRELPTRLAPATGLLIDERRRPDLRDAFGSRCRNSQRIACAVTSIRLATVDLSPEEIARVRSFRVLVAALNALRLDREAQALGMERGRGATIVLRCRPASMGSNARIRTGTLASLHTGDAARDALQRFDELWIAARDVGAAVSALLSRAVGPSARTPAIPT